jgi:hypothetical protein
LVFKVDPVDRRRLSGIGQEFRQLLQEQNIKLINWRQLGGAISIRPLACQTLWMELCGVRRRSHVHPVRSRIGSAT